MKVEPVKVRLLFRTGSSSFILNKRVSIYLCKVLLLAISNEMVVLPRFEGLMDNHEGEIGSKRGQ
jgi:hypothetical protein